MPLVLIFHPAIFSLSHVPCRRFSSLSSLHATPRLLRYSSPTSSLVLFSHSPHSHASPSTILTLPHASSFPFSRFSLHLFRPVPCLSFAFSLWHHSLRSLLARYLKLYFILLFSIASIHLFFQLPTSRFYFTVDRDRPSRRRRRG